MHQLRRLLSHLRPYSLQFSVSVLLMAAVGALGAFPVLLLGPIVDKVLNPSAPGQGLPREARSRALRAAARSLVDARALPWETAEEGLVDFALLPQPIEAALA